MGDDLEQTGSGPQFAAKPISHDRILAIMAFLGVLGSIIGAAFVSIGFGLGVFVGSVLAFVNYFWLKTSLKQIFELAAETGERPRLLGLKYFARYLVLGVIVAAIYVTGAISITGVILGLAGFGFAVVLEGLIRIFAGGTDGKEH